jgi:sigma-B regulation protein RsbU (phosphoserine phosphatase)
MDQRKLYRTIEKIMVEAPKLEKEDSILEYVLEQIIQNEEIDIIGGRIWKLSPEKNAYILMKQEGDVELIEDNYEVFVDKYPMFKHVGQQRSVMAEETDEYLIRKGIYHYSATGVGERYKIKSVGDFYYLYQYLIALNAKNIDEGLLDTLNIISSTLSSILRSRKLESKAKENLQELEKAREIQKSILPEHEMKFGNYEIFGISIPDQMVGGDFFDYIGEEDGDRLGIAIGDAASKGFSAAAQALYVSGALKMGMEFNIKMATVIGKVNRLVYDTFTYERFVTLFYCELHTDKKGLCQFVNAGHSPPLLLNSRCNEIEYIGTTGPVLGPAPKQRYYSDSVNLKKDDILLLHSDGITEAADADFNFFGDERLKESLLKNKELSAREICEKILEEVEIFSANGKYSDDKTIVVIKRVM